MRRLTALLFLGLLLMPGTATASSLRSYTSSRYGFSLRYPSAWRVSTTNQFGVEQVVLTSRGGQTYTVIVSIPPIKPGRSRGQTLARFLQYERRTGNVALASVRWSPTSLAGRQTSVGLMTPPTEGGVVISQALYVAGWRAHIIEIALYAHEKHPLARVSQLPAAYRRVLASWRFR